MDMYIYINIYIYIYVCVCVCSCYRTVTSVVWEIFSKFLILCNKWWQNMRNEKNICQYCTTQRAITFLLLNAY